MSVPFCTALPNQPLDGRLFPWKMNVAFVVTPFFKTSATAACALLKPAVLFSFPARACLYVGRVIAWNWPDSTTFVTFTSLPGATYCFSPLFARLRIADVTASCPALLDVQASAQTRAVTLFCSTGVSWFSSCASSSLYNRCMAAATAPSAKIASYTVLFTPSADSLNQCESRKGRRSCRVDRLQDVHSRSQRLQGSSATRAPSIYLRL